MFHPFAMQLSFGVYLSLKLTKIARIHHSDNNSLFDRRNDLVLVCNLIAVGILEPRF